MPPPTLPSAKAPNRKFNASTVAYNAKLQMEATGASMPKALAFLLNHLTPEDYQAHPPGPLAQPYVTLWLSSHGADERMASLHPAIEALIRKRIPAAAVYRAALESYSYKPHLRAKIAVTYGLRKKQSRPSKQPSSSIHKYGQKSMNCHLLLP